MTPIDLSTITLKVGRHPTRDDGLCLLEAVAWLAGEPHSDHPACASPVLGAFGRSWNDSLRTDEERTRLLAPFAPRLVGTAATPDIEERRAYLALDWLIRVHTPAWLRLVPALADHADALTAFPPITNLDTATRAGDQVRTAWAADEDAARAAAWAAARAAAEDAARDALEPTVVELQASAADLYARMIEVTA